MQFHNYKSLNHAEGRDVVMAMQRLDIKQTKQCYSDYADIDIKFSTCHNTFI